MKRRTKQRMGKIPGKVIKKRTKHMTKGVFLKGKTMTPNFLGFKEKKI